MTSFILEFRKCEPDSIYSYSELSSNVFSVVSSQVNVQGSTALKDERNLIQVSGFLLLLGKKK